jgi:hypothetical protein
MTWRTGKRDTTEHRDAMQEFADRSRPPPKVKSKIGRRFGRLVVVAFSHVGPHPKRLAHWVCLCDCGTEKVILGKSLGTPTLSCGCLQKEWASQPKPERRKHPVAGSRSRLYGIYCNMLNRCYSPENPAFHNYGGRGIKICDEWLADRGKFFDWALANGYEDHLEIDREDNDLDYTPSNCRWVTSQVNGNNTRTNHYVVFNGRRMSIASLARQIGMEYYNLHQRIVKLKWPLDKAVSTPIKRFS